MYLNMKQKGLAKFEKSAAAAFVARWHNLPGGRESASSQLFFGELFQLLGIRPNYNLEGDITFEKSVQVHGEPALKRIDVYKRGVFVIEAKQGSALGDNTAGHGRRGTSAYARTMERAFHQGLRYAQHLPEGVPPVLMVADIGHEFHIWTSFQGNFRGWGARTTFSLEQLKDEKVFQLLYDLFTDPGRRDPQNVSAKITKEIADILSSLSESLESGGEDPEVVAKFLIRCIFTMFAEDMGILKAKLFEDLIKANLDSDPSIFQEHLGELWKEMAGGGSLYGVGRIPHINGKLLEDSTVLPMSSDQLGMLLDAAKVDWSEVEPSIFGSLLEKSLSPTERHSLGAHYTPRAYIERLVWHTLIKELRDEFAMVRAQIQQLVKRERRGDLAEAGKLANGFRLKLSRVQVLDPACGSGNFLYVTFDMLKQLEQEVIVQIKDLGLAQSELGMEGNLVTIAQMHGIEVKPWARDLAELVLWIGSIQWWYKLHPNAPHPEPVLKQHNTVLLQDAVLSKDGGRAVWPVKPPAAGEQPVWYIVGNPPFIGASRMLDSLGKDYVDAIRSAWKCNLISSCDFVMFWWDHAAKLLMDGHVKSFGFITTSSIKGMYNSKIVSRALESEKMHLSYAVPDHPWSNVKDAAGVRVAFTVGRAGKGDGVLERVIRSYSSGSGSDAFVIETVEETGLIFANLRIGADVASANQLKSIRSLGSRGALVNGAGFIITQKHARELGLGSVPDLDRYIRNYRNGRDILRKSRNVMVINLDGLSEKEVKDKFPRVYHHLYDHVRTKRKDNSKEKLSLGWWLLESARRGAAFHIGTRYIARVETAARHIVQFLDGDILPDNKIFAIGLSDGYSLSVLQSRQHEAWVQACGSERGAATYTKAKCFNPFPFPDPTPDQRQALNEAGDALDAHRKCVQAEHPDVWLTDVYNVMAKMRAGEELSAAEKKISNQAMISSHLIPMHDTIDRLVSDAYGWDVDIQGEELLGKILALNQARAEEEAAGHVRWLRPEYQAPGAIAHEISEAVTEQLTDAPQVETPFDTPAPARKPVLSAPSGNWGAKLSERVRSVREHIKARPGMNSSQIRSAVGAQSTPEVQELLEAMLETGVVFETENGLWF